jgi:hypothetical protein
VAALAGRTVILMMGTSRFGRLWSITAVLFFVLLASCTFNPGAGAISSGAHPAKWRLTPRTVIPRSEADALFSVSCVTISDCFAVGAFNPDSTSGVEPFPLVVSSGVQPLIEHFNGKRWAVVHIGTLNAALYGVSCPSKSFCVAVGFTGAGTSLTERYDGKSWSVVPSPNETTFPTNVNRLWAVSCESPTACVAVGSDFGEQEMSGEVVQQLIESYDGETWTLVSVPSSWHGDLTGVSCSGKQCLTAGFSDGLPGLASDPWAGGVGGPGGFVSSGGMWSTAATPPTDLGDMSCFVNGTCMAAPGPTFPNGTENAVTSYYLGRWSIKHLPTPTWAVRTGAEINALSCVSKISCVAAGTGIPKGGGDVATDVPPNRNVIEQLSGRKWSVVPSPNVATGSGNALNAVSCPQQNECVAVGMSYYSVEYSMELPQTITMIERP